MISARDSKMMREALYRLVGHARSSETSDGTWTHVIREEDLDFASLVLSECESAEKYADEWLVIQAEDAEGFVRVPQKSNLLWIKESELLEYLRALGLWQSAAELWMERHPYQRRFNDYPGRE